MCEAVRELHFNGGVPGIVKLIVVDIGNAVEFLKDHTQNIVAIGCLEKGGVRIEAYPCTKLTHQIVQVLRQQSMHVVDFIWRDENTLRMNSSVQEFVCVVLRLGIRNVCDCAQVSIPNGS